MAFYIKVTKQVADKLGVTAIRNKTADGNVLLWQADVTAMPGETIFERAAYVGGVCLQPIQAKEETDGTEYPVEVYTPDYFKPGTVPATDIEQPDETADAEILPDEDTVPAEEIVPNEENPVDETLTPDEETGSSVDNPLNSVENPEKGGVV